MSSTMTEIKMTLTLLESNNPDIVHQAKTLILETFKETKESWLLNGLYDYYMSYDSTPCMEILVTVWNPHDKFLLEKICDSLKQNNKQLLQMKALVLLCHLIRKGPAWLYKIGQTALLKELMKLSKSEHCHLTLMIGSLLALTSLIPVIPAQVADLVKEFLEIFSHAAHVALIKKDELNEETLLHFHMALFSMFTHLYGLFPCNFVCFLRERFSVVDNRNVYANIIKPMINQIRMHPLLVTNSKDAEVSAERWKNVGDSSDLYTECTRYSLECLVIGKDTKLGEESLQFRRHELSSNYVLLDSNTIKPSPIKDEPGDEIWSPSFVCSNVGSGGDEFSRPRSQTSLPTSPQVVEPVSTCSSPALITGSPPECAIEATPENTPLTTPIKEVEAHLSRRPLTHSKISRALFNNIRSSSDGGDSSTPASPSQKDLPCADITKHVVTAHTISSESTDRIDVPGSRFSENVPLEFSDNPVLPGKKIPRPIPCLSSSFDITLLGSVTDSRQSFQADDSEVAAIVQGKSFGKVGKDCAIRSDSVIKDGKGHMPVWEPDVTSTDHTSMGKFLKQASRIRYYSHCITSQPTQELKYHRKRHKLTDLKRTHSLPALLKGRARRDMKQRAVDKTPVVLVPKIEKSTQTCKEPFDVLYPCLLNPRSVSEQIRIRRESEKLTELSPKTFIQKYVDCIMRQPYELWRAPDSGFERHLLSIQLLFEKTKRNLNVQRNNRMVAGAKETARLEEINSAFRDQIATIESETINLRTQVEQSRHDLISAKEDCDKKLSDKDKQVMALRKSRDCLKSQLDDKTLECDTLREKLHMANKELESVQARCFMCEKELDHYHSQMKTASDTKEELLRLKKEMVLQEEMKKRVEEKHEKFVARAKTQDDIDMLSESFNRDLQQLKFAVSVKGMELDASRAKLSELENVVGKKDRAISQLKREIEDLRHCYEDRLRIIQDNYQAALKMNTCLEEAHLKLAEKNEILSRKLRRAIKAQSVSGAEGAIDIKSSSPGSDIDDSSPQTGSAPQFPETVSFDPRSIQRWDEPTIPSNDQVLPLRPPGVTTNNASSSGRAGLLDLSQIILEQESERDRRVLLN